MKTTLLIMAAGIGSRYGGGIKQLAQVGPTGEIIMDYSIYDAIKAGFNKIVFIIRKDIEDDFKVIIGERIEKICKEIGVEVDYTFQSLDDIPEGVKVPEGRTKPWGTGQAVLAAKDIVKEPFAVINADDYYGKEAFAKIHDFLVSDQLKPNAFCMAGFILKNTLSDNGGVTRGICKVDENGYLTDVVETSDIVKVAGGAQTKGVDVDVESLVSMNMWGLAPEFMSTLETGFEEFFKTVDANPLKSEYLLPIYIGQLLRENKVSVKVLSTKDTWFGVTYQEDKEYVVNEFKKLVDAGVYNADLFSDL
ncbi:MAG: nucleotidyltransferase [Oscillospiraceae bacterium]|nr:nucleotidyltransferase [Oscillospiraceae bacterium]MBP1570886.1 nucleotidyltransferase [Oscillospiraceae bacterium]MBQ5325496.1 nucleotidyltransferase [Oscillospiraceae bacterium]